MAHIDAVTTQVIEIQQIHSGWQVRGAEAAASFPFFIGPRAVEHAIDYAWESVAQRGAEIRLLARNGQVISAMAFEKRREGSFEDFLSRLAG